MKKLLLIVVLALSVPSVFAQTSGALLMKDTSLYHPTSPKFQIIVDSSGDPYLRKDDQKYYPIMTSGASGSASVGVAGTASYWSTATELTSDTGYHISGNARTINSPSGTTPFTINHSGTVPTINVLTNFNTITHMQMTNTNAGAGAYTGLRFSNNNGLNTQIMLASSGAAGAFGLSGSALLLQNITGDIGVISPVGHIILKAGGSAGIGTERMRVASTGSVLIGTQTDASTGLLQVAGKTAIAGSGTSSLRLGIANDYADNAAALLAGLAVGDIYRTGDILKIVH